MSINSDYKMLQKFYTYRKFLHDTWNCILTLTLILKLRAGDSRMALGQGLHSTMGGQSENSHLFPFHSRMAPILTTRGTFTRKYRTQKPKVRRKVRALEIVKNDFFSCSLTVALKKLKINKPCSYFSASYHTGIQQQHGLHRPLHVWQETGTFHHLF